MEDIVLVIIINISMPAYHSRIDIWGDRQACGMAIMNLETSVRGPAYIATKEDGMDIIEEALYYFRANVLFRNFEVKTPCDLTLVVVTLYIQLCLKECEKYPTEAEAKRALTTLALKQFAIPGEPGFPLSAMFTRAENIEESDLFRNYYRQLREEVNKRILGRLYHEDGSKNKWWQSFSKRKFMGKEITAR